MQQEKDQGHGIETSFGGISTQSGIRVSFRVVTQMYRLLYFTLYLLRRSHNTPIPVVLPKISLLNVVKL